MGKNGEGAGCRLWVRLLQAGLLLLLGILVWGTCWDSSHRTYSPRLSTSLPSPTVVYEAETQNYKRMSLTLANDQGGTEQVDTGYRFERTFHSFDYGDFTYLSAQCDAEYCTITCRILVNGDVWRESTSSGSYVIASCSGRLGSE